MLGKSKSIILTAVALCVLVVVFINLNVNVNDSALENKINAIRDAQISGRYNTCVNYCIDTNDCSGIDIICKTQRQSCMDNCDAAYLGTDLDDLNETDDSNNDLIEGEVSDAPVVEQND